MTSPGARERREGSGERWHYGGRLGVEAMRERNKDESGEVEDLGGFEASLSSTLIGPYFIRRKPVAEQLRHNPYRPWEMYWTILTIDILAELFEMDSVEIEVGSFAELRKRKKADSEIQQVEVDLQPKRQKSGTEPKSTKKTSNEPLKTSQHNPKSTEVDQISMEYREGDLFSADENSIFVHSCNCVGSWGKGIAAEFKKRFPEHYAAYNKHCKSHKPGDILGTALLLGPHLPGIKDKRWVGCLFTRPKPGKAPASKAEEDRTRTCENTTKAMDHLLCQIHEHGKNETGEIAMPKINAGLFAVPWERTVEALKQVGVPEDLRQRKVVLYEPAKPQWEGDER